VVKIIVKEKELDNTKRASVIIYVGDLTEFARILLAIIQMTFEIGWLQIE
jgi:hypothetical protein